MATAYRAYTIFQGDPDEIDTTLTLLGIGSAGDPGALRRLVHPDAVNFPAIIYWSNPDRTSNLDNDVLKHPITNTVITAGTTRLVRYETALHDAVCIETWEAGGRKYAMPTYFFRELYEYLANPPVYDPVSPEYIQWSPRDRAANSDGTPRVFAVEFFRLTVGGGSDRQEFDVSDWRDAGGPYDPKSPGPILNGLDTLDASPTGVVDQTVQAHFKIVGEITS